MFLAMRLGEREIIIAKIMKHQFSLSMCKPRISLVVQYPSSEVAGHALAAKSTVLSSYSHPAMWWLPLGSETASSSIPASIFHIDFYRKMVTLIWIKMEMLLIAPCGVRQFGHLKMITLVQSNLLRREFVSTCVCVCLLPLGYEGLFFKPCRVFCLCSLPVCCFCPHCCNWVVNFELLWLHCD